MSRSFLYLAGLAGAISLAAACSANSSSSVFGSGGGGSDSSGSGSTKSGANTGAGVGGSSLDGTGGGFNPTSGSGGSSGTSGTTCVSGPDEDKDKDGFSVNQGDCNDCDPNVNPGAIEVIAQPDADGGVPQAADEDCDGTVDNVPGTCDDNIALADTDPMNGARAIDLCQQAGANDKKWGVLSAKYVRVNGTAASPGLQVGIQSTFGPNVHPQGGKRMLALSSGRARTPDQNGACGSEGCTYGSGPSMQWFPQDVPNCPGDKSINDDVGLDVKLRAPTNATGYGFNFKFHSFEFSEWVCTSYNDQFIALVTPEPNGSIHGNVSFDSKGNPVSVNIAFFDVCDQSTKATFAENCFQNCPSAPNPYCPLGPSELQGTGFGSDTGWGDAGATSWLGTQVPVTGGEEFSIRFAIWDTGDSVLDSTALVDNFQWIANGGTVAIGTTPVPVPK